MRAPITRHILTLDAFPTEFTHLIASATHGSRTGRPKHLQIDVKINEAGEASTSFSIVLDGASLTAKTFPEAVRLYNEA